MGDCVKELANSHPYRYRQFVQNVMHILSMNSKYAVLRQATEYIVNGLQGCISNEMYST